MFNNERVIFGAARTKNQFVNSCSVCGLCEAVCPNDFNMGDLTLQARRTMNEQKFMPLSFHEFALQDMAQSNGESFALSIPESETEKSRWLYFPSCQLCATSPGEVLSSYRYLKERLSGGVGIMLGCCGAPAFWAGRDDLFGEVMEKLRLEWERMGKPQIITACSTCQSIFREHIFKVEPVSLWKIVEEYGLPLETCAFSGKTVSVTDPCITRYDTDTQESVRRIIHSLGVAVEELPSCGDRAECCGYGGLMYNTNPKLAKDAVARRVSLKSKTGDNLDYLAYCAICRDNFAAAGKRVSHLIELLFPMTGGGDPAARGWISWSERRLNRTKVRGGILKELGKKGESVVERYENIRLEMTSELLRITDERRILEDDIKMVIDHAERSGKRLKRSQSGEFLACHQLQNVTFWVEYAPQGDRFRVHNAYCHRMNIVGVKK